MSSALRTPLLRPGLPLSIGYSATDNVSTTTLINQAACLTNAKIGVDSELFSSVSTLAVPDIESQAAPTPSEHGGIRAFLFQDIDTDRASLPMAAYCFMTGYIDILAFSSVSIWCGFQTGNTAQLAIALARLFEDELSGGHATHFGLPEKLALTSVCAFLFGAFLGRIGDSPWMGGAKSRAWLVLGTFVQTLMTMAAAIAIHASGQASISSARNDPVWWSAGGFVCVAFLSTSLGLQGIMGKRLDTQYATTIVLTAIWCELMADPQLFRPKLVKTRDSKLCAIGALLCGVFVSRAVLQVLGAAGTLAVGTGVRVLITVSWLFVPRT